MTPMPTIPKIVLLVDEMGFVNANVNNLGNDLKIVVVLTQEEFDKESKGIPYVGKINQFN